ncbi:hypothetical protein CBER1_11662 [Cercospora berteroae]|uniref:Cytochrome P450 n=1 Tax=Cercospora berteroae TaxID=357750 RepID=A0A2S6CIG0_9PEZI|nr:hypothetical protein CBER1_11662 [Cercospora berteroae]
MFPNYLIGLFKVLCQSILFLTLSTISLVIYRLFFHPLAKVPGPRLAAISNIWYADHARNGDMLRLGKTLHRKYGHAVRVGPNEIWLDSKESFAKIYSATQGYDKSNFYVATSLNRPKFDFSSFKLHSPDTLDLLSERDMDRYRLQRRLIGPLYSMHNVQRYEKAIDEVLIKVVAQLKLLKGSQVDLKMWMHIITVECLSAIVLSYSPGYLKAQNDFGSSSHAYMNWRRKSVFGLFTWAVLAESYSKAAGRLFARLWRVTFVTLAPFKPFFTPVYSKITKRITAALQPKPPKDNRQDLISDLIDLHKEKPEFTLTYLKRMAMTNFGAGHETTTSALISSIAMIASHSAVRARVETEARQHQTEGLISYSEVIGLAYTQATIKEAQRLYPVLGMSPSRTVPSTESGGLHLHSFHIPPATRVGCNPVSLHRNPDIFGPDAEDFVPERWLGDNTSGREMERYNLTWGGGARTCPGKNLAQLILYKVVATLFREFEIEVEMPDEEEIKYYFMAMLTGVKVRLRPIIQAEERGEG